MRGVPDVNRRQITWTRLRILWHVISVCRQVAGNRPTPAAPIADTQHGITVHGRFTQLVEPAARAPISSLAYEWTSMHAFTFSTIS